MHVDELYESVQDIVVAQDATGAFDLRLTVESFITWAASPLEQDDDGTIFDRVAVETIEPSQPMPWHEPKDSTLLLSLGRWVALPESRSDYGMHEEYGIWLVYSVADLPTPLPRFSGYVENSGGDQAPEPSTSGVQASRALSPANDSPMTAMDRCISSRRRTPQTRCHAA